MIVQYGKMQKIGKNTQTENQIKQIRQQIKRCLEENKTETPTKVPTQSRPQLKNFKTTYRQRNIRKLRTYRQTNIKTGPIIEIDHLKKIKTEALVKARHSKYIKI